MVGLRARSAPIAGTLGGLRVLVVDDEADARDLLTTMLETAGAVVSVVGTAVEALDALAKQRPDLLLSDLAMPLHDGYDLMREARGRGVAEGVATIALSAQARPEDRARALAAGFDAHVAKPVDPDVLVAEIRSLIGRRDRRS
jgi:CheY-like chemotaxis protein